MSDETASLIDSEVRRIVDQAYTRARTVLTEKIDDLHTLAKALLEYELLSGDEIKALLRGEKITRSDSSDEGPAQSRPSIPRGGGLDIGPESRGTI